MAHPQFDVTLMMRPAQCCEERTRDEAEPAEVDKRAQVGGLRLPGRHDRMNRSQNVESLGANENSLTRMAVKIADRATEHIDGDHIVGVGLFGVLGNSNLTALRYERGIRRIVREEDRRKVLINRSGPGQRPGNGGAGADLFMRKAFDLIAIIEVDSAGRKTGGTGRIAKTRWPCRETPGWPLRSEQPRCPF